MVADVLLLLTFIQLINCTLVFPQYAMVGLLNLRTLHVMWNAKQWSLSSTII